MLLFNATVIFPAGKIFENQYGPSHSAKIQLEDGQNVDVWEKPNGVIASWRKGQKVAVTMNSRGKYEAVLNYGESVTQTPTCAPAVFEPFVLPGLVAPQAVPVATVQPVRAYSVTPAAVNNQVQQQPESKRVTYAQSAEMLSYSADAAKLYHCIFNQVNEQFADLLLKDELLKDITTTIFIQTNRRFNT